MKREKKRRQKKTLTLLLQIMYRRKTKKKRARIMDHGYNRWLKASIKPKEHLPAGNGGERENLQHARSIKRTQDEYGYVPAEGFQI